MYAAARDPYLYPGTDTLKNRPGIRDPEILASFEADMSFQRAGEPFPAGRVTMTHYQAFHRHLFQDVYSWAGRLRTVRLARGASMFCYPEHIRDELRRVFGWLKEKRYLRNLTRTGFATNAAHFLAELNAIHAFREGNGRTQMAFVSYIAMSADHPLDLELLDAGRFLAAMIDSFNGDEKPLAREIESLI